VKEFRKLVNICQSYGQESSVPFCSGSLGIMAYYSDECINRADKVTDSLQQVFDTMWTA